jgi:hypothetical protein
LKVHLELPRYELQAMTALEDAIHLQSRSECCSDARVDVKFAENCRVKHVLPNFQRTKVQCGFNELGVSARL